MNIIKEHGSGTTNAMQYRGLEEAVIVRMVEDAIERIIDDSTDNAIDRVAQDLRADPDMVAEIFNRHMEATND